MGKYRCVALCGCVYVEARGHCLVPSLKTLPLFISLLVWRQSLSLSLEVISLSRLISLQVSRMPQSAQPLVRLQVYPKIVLHAYVEIINNQTASLNEL